MTTEPTQHASSEGDGTNAALCTPPSTGNSLLRRVALHMQVNKLDWIVFNVALFCTMFAGVDIGLGISIGTSVVLALYKSAFPKTSMLGRLPDTTVYRYCLFLPAIMPASKWSTFLTSMPLDSHDAHRLCKSCAPT